MLLEQYTEAIEFYTQAIAVSPGNTGLDEKLQHVRQLKLTSEKVALLLQQAREARQRNDYEIAGQLLDQAIQIDGRNTNLRNERARVIQDAQRAAKEQARRQYTQAGREQLGTRQYTDAIQSLRSALEIDPTDAEVQKMYEDAVARQEEQRRRKIIDQIVAEIQSSIFSEEFDRALSQIRSAQEKLPGEAVLLQLKSEAETKQREVFIRKLVEKTSLTVYSLFLSDPQEALSQVRQALEKVPGDPRLIALEEKVLEQLRKANLEGMKAQFLKRAQDSIDAQEFDQAVQILEQATAECGASPDISYLLTYARDQQRKNQLRNMASNALREGQALIAKGDLEAAMAVLQPAAKETGDAAIEQLIRQVSGRVTELNRRADEAVAQARALGEKEPSQGLQFLAAQPAEIQQHSRVRELRTWLETAVERDRLTLEAIKQAIEALQRRDLRHGMDALEAVRRSHGDSPRIASAATEFQKRRLQIANEQTAPSVEAANQAVAMQNYPAAQQELNRAVEVVDFADAPLQAEWRRLSQLCAKPPKFKKPKPVAAANFTTSQTVGAVQTAGAAKTGNSKILLIVGIAVVVLIAAGIGYWFLSRPKPVPPAPVGMLQITATPFAEVVSITSEQGTAVALPAGAATPLRLDGLAAGRYSVVVKGPDGAVQPPQSCVVGEQAAPCTFALKPIGDAELDEIVGAAK